jgi:membrane protein
MNNFISSVRKKSQFVSKDLWNVRLNKIEKKQGFLIKQLRILSLAIKGFKEDNCLTQATALTFYTLFSIVPIFALFFAIAKGFGFDKSLQQQLLTDYAEYGTVMNNAFTYANSMLANAKGGVIAGFGVVLLLFSVMKLLINIENSFNDIWHIKRGRSFVRKLTDYLTIMLVAPLFLIVSGGVTVAFQTQVGEVAILGFVGVILIKLLAYALVACVFTFIYMALPNTKVNYKSAILAGIVATLLFEMLQWGYVKFQVGANHLNAIYGGFAALPLFLIWVQYSWYIVLFGMELAYANQNVDHYELENDIKNLSTRYKKAIALMIANLVSKRFYNKEKSLTANEISEKLDLPVRLTKNIINEFVDTNLFVEVKTEMEKEIVYQPGVTESKLTVKYILDALERNGNNSLPINDTVELVTINQLIKEMDHAMDNDLGNQFVKDIVR